MAVETQTRPPAVSAESNGHRRVTRLHEEILPPALAPSTPAARRRARRALVILAIGMILIQFISAPIGHRLDAVLRSGTDVYSQWQRYTSGPAPDVLFLGASQVATGIDVTVMSSEMSRVAGHSVTVDKLGFFGQGSTFLDVVMYRVMKRASRPKLVVISLAAPDLNAGCSECQASSTAGIWDISDLKDPGFVQLALNTEVVQPGAGVLGKLEQTDSRAPLVLGWALPSFAYYPSLLAVQCVAIKYGRVASKAVSGTIAQPLRQPSLCETTLPYTWPLSQEMTASSYASSLTSARQFMSNYRVSMSVVARLTDMVQLARAAGSDVVFFKPPVHSGARSVIGPDAQPAFSAEVNHLTTSLSVDAFDFSKAVPDDPALWVDVLHLDKAGADYLAPELADKLARLAVLS